VGALVVAIVAALAGALGLGLAAAHLSSRLNADWRARVARRCVVLLSGLAGAEIATQLVELVRELEANHAAVSGSIGSSLRAGLDAVDIAVAFREVLFAGGLLIGLAAVVGLAAMRRYRVACD
jgi:hypothetical protein